jgi:hypothetical protein
LKLFIAYFHGKYGLEADATISLEDERYALFEIKLESNEVDSGAQLIEPCAPILQYMTTLHKYSARNHF